MNSPRTIVLVPSGRRVAVTVEPRSVERSSRSFQSFDEALDYAQQLGEFHGWLIVRRGR